MLYFNLYFFHSIEIANRAAEQFTRVYYDSYDSDTRLADVPNFYRENSSLTWNGTLYHGTGGVKQLLENMPPTKHEKQSYDCHPIPGASKVTSRSFKALTGR